MPFAVGVVHLGHRALLRSVRAVAPEDRDRVERVAQHAGAREHQDPAAAEVDALQRQPAVEVLADAAVRVAEVVAGVEADQRAQRPGQPGQVVEVDQPGVGPVPEAAARLDLAGVGDDDVVEAQDHHPEPRAVAARTPDRQPSSWNPHPW